MKRFLLLFPYFPLLGNLLPNLLFYASFVYFFTSCQTKETEKTVKNNQIEKDTKDSLKNILENISKKPSEDISEKSTEKPPEKLDSATIMAKLTKKWEITGNYWVSSIQTFNNNENYFLDLQKEGKYTLKAYLEDVSINETGKWELQNPKPAFRKFDEADSKEVGVPLEDNEQVLILIPKNNTSNKGKLFLFNFEEKVFAFHTFTRPSGFFAK